jgi:hypothetical protein
VPGRSQNEHGNGARAEAPDLVGARSGAAPGSALAQYFRDLTIGEVIRGSQYIEHRPFGNIATVQRLGTDLRFALDRSVYGNILALTNEVGHYLSSLLDLFDTPDIKKSFDANTKWDVIEAVSNRHLGGTRELAKVQDGRDRKARPAIDR